MAATGPAKMAAETMNHYYFCVEYIGKKPDVLVSHRKPSFCSLSIIHTHFSSSRKFSISKSTNDRRARASQRARQRKCSTTETRSWLPASASLHISRQQRRARGRQRARSTISLESKDALVAASELFTASASNRYAVLCLRTATTPW